MRILIAFLILFSMSSIGKSQSNAEEHFYFDVNYKTMLGHYNRGNYAKAAEYPDSLLNNKYTDKHAFYMMARVYALNIEYLDALENLEKAVKLGITKSQIEKMYDLDAFRESDMNVVFELNYDKWHKDYLDSEHTGNIDSSYLQAIESYQLIYTEAQKKRNYIEKKDSSWFSKDSLSEYKIDSVYHKTIDYILQNGYPTYQRIGNSFYSFSHFIKYERPEKFPFNDEKWLQVKALIDREIRKRTIKPFYYATLEDYYRLSNNMLQLNGTINFTYPSENSPINNVQYEKPELLNQRRRAIGLCPIQLKLWSQARDLPPSLQNIEFK